MRKKIKAFTIIELLIVIAIIGILATISVVSFGRVRANARDSQRSSKITVIAEALEKYYDKNGEYPSCSAMSQPASTIADSTLTGIRSDALTAPGGTIGTSSILTSCGDLTTGTDAFSYIGDSGTPCLTGTGQTSACVQYTLKYREESTNNIVSITSRRRITEIDTPAIPTVTVTLNGANALATITPVACTIGTTQYGIKSRTNDGTWGSYTAWSTTTTASQAANDGVKYGYQAQARCYVNEVSFSTTVTGSESTYIDPIATPTAPTVSANTVAATTTWSWPAVACAAGTTVRHQYDYSTSYGYDSGWVATAGTSVAFTTSTEGYTYTVAVQSQCYNANTNSGWSVSGSASYYRPITIITYVLTTIAGTGGSVSSGGTYDAGSTPTITATPSANYIFGSWTGSTGCSGIASHTITIDANKTCTANFIATYTIAISAGVGGTVNTAINGTYNSGSTPTITATASTYYSFTSWTGSTGCSGIASHTITMDANKTCTANFTPTPIAAPAAPSVAANTSGATTTWSWGAVSCPGNSVRYQYNYTINSGYNSGWVATAGTSVAFTTSSEGYTYTVAAQSQCYNAVTSSGWSGSGSASYYRPSSFVATSSLSNTTNSFPATVSYNSNGYTGTLSKNGNSTSNTVQTGGSYIEADSKYISGYSGGTSTTFASYIYTISGWVIYSEFLGDKSNSISYDSGGYSGTLSKNFWLTGTSGSQPSNPVIGSTYTLYRYWGYDYSGIVTRPASDTRTYTTTYTQSYSGTVTK